MRPDAIRGLARRGAGGLVHLVPTLVALGLLWPVPLGRPPLGADHTVHLTRAALWADHLAQGRVRGWAPEWFLGTPIGELYPVAGDLLVVAGRAFGLLSWPAAYALAFTVVFASQAWALQRAAARLGLAPGAGTLAGILVLLDPGAYREGGWIYTVEYGVWPQALATSAFWWGLAEGWVGVADPDGTRRARATAYAGLACGLAILAHPMTLPLLGLGAAWLVLVGLLAAQDRDARRAVPARVTAILLLGLGIAAWWLVPLLDASGYSASYGWLHRPLSAALPALAQGRFATHVSGLVGACVVVGLVAAAVGRSAPLRVVAGCAVTTWICAHADVFWGLRLDLLSPGFSHIQYQRFLVAAKPGLFLLAAAAVASLVAHARDTRWPAARRTLAGFAGAALAVACLHGSWESRDAVGQREPQVERFPGHPERDAAYAEFLAWAQHRWEERREFFRFAVREARNVHWFVDATVATGIPLFKTGFTPGDNFVHKPESTRPDVLDAAGVRWWLEPDGTRARDPAQRFGTWAVVERTTTRPLAWLATRDPGSGALVDARGEVEILAADLWEGRVRGRVSGAVAGDRLVFAIAGHPRWQLQVDGTPRAWRETPIWGTARDLTPAERRAGAALGGKAHGDDGSEPILISAEASDGTFELQFEHTRSKDRLALLGSLLALLAGALLLLRKRSDALPPRLLHLTRRLPARLQVALCLALLAAWSARGWSRGHALESRRAVGWWDTDAAQARGFAREPLKADMLPRPALVATPGGPHEITFHGVTIPDGGLAGWIALDDDVAKARARGTLELHVETAPHGTANYSEVVARRIPHRPGLQAWTLPAGDSARSDVRVRIVDHGPGSRVGFDLELGGGPP